MELYIVTTVVGSLLLGTLLGYLMGWSTHRGKLESYIRGREDEHRQHAASEWARSGPPWLDEVDAPEVDDDPQETAEDPPLGPP